MRNKFFVCFMFLMASFILLLNKSYSQNEGLNKKEIGVESVEVENAFTFILNKFDNYDIIILGENHRVKSELDFTNKLLPYLYNYGVKTFAFEFLSQESQDKIDQLLIKDTFDNELLNNIISYKPRWYIKEYKQLIYCLWQLNKRKDISIIACDGSENNSSVDRDSLMAKNILANYQKTKERIFVYCGRNHSFTDFYQYRGKEEKIKRMGNILYERNPKQVYNINFFPTIVLDTSNTYCIYNLPNIDSSAYKEPKAIDIDNTLYKDYFLNDKNLARNPKHSLGDIFNGVIILNQIELQICESDQAIENYRTMFEEYKEMIQIFKTIKNCNCLNKY
ncbi:MAG: hypothetical protein RBT05_04040 [Bacteroidales bacterium]|nr:hypothetical protein [Bacteroidales bacterium]